MTQTINGLIYEIEEVVQPGETKIVQMPGVGPASVAVHAQGGSADVAYFLSPLARIKAGQGRPLPAAMGANGTVTDASACVDIPGPVNAIRVINTGTVPVYVEVLQ